LSSEKQFVTSELAVWRNSEAPGKKRALADGRPFMIKCVLRRYIYILIIQQIGSLGFGIPLELWGYQDLSEKNPRYMVSTIPS
jgi:hypothetical protein